MWENSKNFASSSQHHGYAGLNGVLCNCVGDFQLTYDIAIIVNSSTMAMCVVPDGLWINRRSGFLHLIGEIDSIFVLNAFVQEVAPKQTGSINRVLWDAPTGF